MNLEERTRGLVFAVAITSVLVLASVAAIVFSSRHVASPIKGLDPQSSGLTFQDEYVVTNDASQYFPSGYQEQSVNLNQMRNGSEVLLGGLTLAYLTRSSPFIDYICDSFFVAHFPNGSQFTLDYCIPYGDAARVATMTMEVKTGNGTGIELFTVGAPWSEWELSRNTTPRIGINVQGVGNNVTLVELVVGN